jgi:radical SAM domain protein
MNKGKEKMELQYKLDQLLKRVEKPGRYIGGEINSARKDPNSVDANFAFAFPDIYEIGMSYLGLQILYHELNQCENIFCQRVFAPAVDMEKLMREEGVPLMTLEAKMPLREMDIVGFTLQYEMSFTTVLNMLDLAKIPVFAAERNENDPLIIAGGPCAFNPEPLTDFIDVFLIGDGEKLLPAFVEKYIDCKKKGMAKADCLRELSKLQGVYVPSLYDIKYNDDGTIKELCELYEGAPLPVTRAILPSIEETDFPVNPIIPMVEAVHDRAVTETFRGCTRGCRFCQAGMIYRPVRERSKDRILQLAKTQLENTGHDELSLLSLSTSDYSCFEELATELIDYTKKENVSLSLPSLRIDKFAFDVLNKIQEYKKSGLTYAPEAGTQRLRDVINKGVTEKDIYESIEQALELGWKHIKLYFMIGLPTETYEDLDGIVEIAKNIKELNYKVNGPKGGRFNLTVSVSNFVPKAHTPFQWEAQNTAEEFADKHNYLAERLKIKGVTFNYHDNTTSAYEAVFARGDRRCGRLLYEAFRAGCKFDGWTEHFRPEAWETAFERSGIDKDFYTTRKREFDEILPWDIIDSGISKRFLINEAQKAVKEEITPDCRNGCTGCGMNTKVVCPMAGAAKKGRA